VLTSLGDDDLARLGLPPTRRAVPELARIASTAGCDGIVCSPVDLPHVRAAVPDDGFLIVTPGIRPAGADAGDQARVATPAAAIGGGATHIVVGRPITRAADPAEAARAIVREAMG
jgi:orotidine-5'-phosphate decarboxylase